MNSISFSRLFKHSKSQTEAKTHCGLTVGEDNQGPEHEHDAELHLVFAAVGCHFRVRLISYSCLTTCIYTPLQHIDHVLFLN